MVNFCQWDKYSDGTTKRTAWKLLSVTLEPQNGIGWFLDALASLEFKLSVSNLPFLQLAHLRVFQIIFFSAAALQVNSNDW